MVFVLFPDNAKTWGVGDGEEASLTAGNCLVATS